MEGRGIEVHSGPIRSTVSLDLSSFLCFWYVPVFMCVHIDHNTHVENVEIRGQGYCLSSPSTSWDRLLCFAAVYTGQAGLLGILLCLPYFMMGAWGFENMLLHLALHALWSVWASSIKGACLVYLSLSPECFCILQNWRIQTQVLTLAWQLFYPWAISTAHQGSFLSVSMWTSGKETW